MISDFKFRNNLEQHPPGAGAALESGAGEGLRDGVVEGAAAGVGVALVAGVALALVGPAVGAVAVGAAPGGARRGQRGRHADEVGVAHEALLADAGAAQGVAPGEEAAAVLAAREDAPARLAHLAGLGALGGGGAGLGVALPARVGVAHHALQARARRARGGDDALRVVPAEGALAQGHALTGRVLGVAALASAPGS